MASDKTRNGTKRNGTKRNEMEKIIKSVNSCRYGVVYDETSGLGGHIQLQADSDFSKHRIHYSWTQSNAEGPVPG